LSLSFYDFVFLDRVFLFLIGSKYSTIEARSYRRLEDFLPGFGSGLVMVYFLPPLVL